jgi:serine/threonine protein phosphatase PrpC
MGSVRDISKRSNSFIRFGMAAAVSGAVVALAVPRLRKLGALGALAGAASGGYGFAIRPKHAVDNFSVADLRDTLSDRTTAGARLYTNLLKAIGDGGQDIDNLQDVLNRVMVEPLRATAATVSDIGMGRQSNEDTHLDFEIDEGKLFAIFDGHGGDEVSKRMLEEDAQDIMKDCLRSTENDVEQFETMFAQLHELTAKKHNIPDGLSEEEHEYVYDLPSGSTATIVWKPYSSNIAFIATLGDSEARLYREGSEIPLSPIRNWKSPRDQHRARDAGAAPEWINTWNNPKTTAKDCRSRSVRGLNLSRALGDRDQPLLHGENTKGHGQKPKVVAIPLCEGDRIVLGCDGVWDYVKDPGSIARSKTDPEAQCRQFVETAKAGMTWRSGDNVTVTVIDIVASES